MLPVLILGLAVLSAAPALAQGNDSSSSSTTPGSVEAGVLVGAATTDETTTGSSGPEQVQAHPTSVAPPRTIPSGGSPCERIRDEAVRSRCLNR